MADVYGKVTCTNCQEDITSLRIQCCVCVDFDICLQCFASGAEIGAHKNDHSYKFVDICAVTVFGGKGNWTGLEELQLLDAMELYSFGSWEFVSKHIETRSPEEVKEEYMARYIDGNLGKATWAEVVDLRPNIIDEVQEDTGPLSPAVISHLPPLLISPEEARLLGYMSHRDDYEREYDMSAEQIISSLQLNSAEDNNIDIALKLAHVDIYMRRLRERARRKRMVRDYQLARKFFNSRRESKRPLPKQQRLLRERMKVFSQFFTAGEHERLIESLERERELKFRISELLRYRSLGITSQEDAIHFEQHAAFERYQRLRQKKTTVAKLKSAYAGTTRRAYSFHLGNQWVRGVAGNRRRRRKKAKFNRNKSADAAKRRAKQQQKMHV